MSSNAFSDHFEGRYRISEFRTSTWYLFTHLLLFVRTISASSTNGKIPCTFHEIFRRCYFVYTKVKEDFLFLWPRPTIVQRHNPHRADRGRA